jgi:CRP/FNR family transcriptional regulator, cyclic AMP receptor protein
MDQSRADALSRAPLHGDEPLQPASREGTAMSAPRRNTETTCQLLREDPELGRAVEPNLRGRAEDICITPAVNVRRGRWTRAGDDLGDGAGLLILDGLLLRRVNVRGRSGAELLGKGDLVRPWQAGDCGVQSRRTTAWRALQFTRLAVLDERVLRRLARHPAIIRRLLERSVERSQRLAVNMAIVHHPRVEIRLQMLFWHLADRWGIVRDGRTILPLRLTHTVLADLVAAQRPTVSVALSEMALREILLSTPNGWLLLAPPPEDLLTPREPSPHPPQGSSPRDTEWDLHSAEACPQAHFLDV